MDLKIEEARLYLGVLGGILVTINEMPNPSIRKLRKLLEDEIKEIKEKVDKFIN